MFVLATNLPYLNETKIAIRSLLRFGKVKPELVTVMVFGRKRETLVLAHEFELAFPKINILKIRWDTDNFRFLWSEIEQQHWSTFADYLRAFYGRKKRHYIWLDSDIIACHPLTGLISLLKTKTPIYLAEDYPVPARKTKGETNWILLDHYIDMYRHIFHTPPPLEKSVSGAPAKFNCGVIVINKDFSNEYREYWMRLQSYFSSSKTQKFIKSWPLGYPPLGQGVWNIIYWRNKGLKLDQVWNNIFPFDCCSHAKIVHYCGNFKYYFYYQAKRNGLA